MGEATRDMVSLVQAFGFRLARVSVGQHFVEHLDLSEKVNLQRVKAQAKPHQVRQFLRLVEQHHLQLGEDE